jgi:multiple sugar transport system substrate-binding protein
MNGRRVTYWEKWGGDEIRALREIVQDFNDSQREFEVVVREAGDWSASPDLGAFRAAHAAGNVPDLIGLEDHQICPLAAEGALQPVPTTSADQSKEEAALHPAFAGMGEWNGQSYGTPIVGDIGLLFVNSVLTRGTGLDNSVPTGLDAFTQGLDQIESRGDIAFVPTYPGWWPHAWVWLTGGGWYDDGDCFAPNRDANVEAFAWIRRFRGRERPNGFERITNPIGGNDRDPFFSGRVAAVFDGDWLVRRLIHEPSIDWIPSAMPSRSSVPWYLAMADVLSIPAKAACARGAIAFVRFASRPVNIERLALAQSKISPRATWSHEFVAGHPNGQIRRLRTIMDTATPRREPRAPDWLDRRREIARAFERLWVECASPRQALAALV